MNKIVSEEIETSYVVRIFFASAPRYNVSIDSN